MYQNRHDLASCEKQLRDMLSSEKLNSDSRDKFFELLDEYIGLASESEMDAKLVADCFARLRELHPEKPKYDKEAGLTRLFNAIQSGYYAEYRRKAKRSSRTSRLVGILIAVVALLIITANAFGVNPLTYLYNFAETVSFRLTPSGEMILPPVQKSEFHSLQEALLANGLDIELPQWVPSRFSLSEVGVLASDNTSVFSAVFTAGDKSLQIDVMAYSEERIITFEKIEGEISYVVGDQKYYIISNTDSLTVFWQNNNYSVQVYGHITETEAKHIIYSID